jgi:hypothetical protein
MEDESCFFRLATPLAPARILSRGLTCSFSILFDKTFANLISQYLFIFFSITTRKDSRGSGGIWFFFQT